MTFPANDEVDKITLEEKPLEGKINYQECQLKLEGGSLIVNDLTKVCGGDFSNKAFEIELVDFGELNLQDEKIMVGLYRMREEKKLSKYVLMAFDSKKGHFLTQKLDKRPKDITIEEGNLVLDSVYRLIDKRRFEKIPNDFVSLTSPDYGFSVTIPEKWKSQNTGEGFVFYHPNAKYSYPVMIKASDDLEIITSPETPYQREVKKIKESLQLEYDFNRLPDYNLFRGRLDNYLEVNTVTGKINYYQNNLLKESFNVLASGSPVGWQGTPSGLYEILSKEGLRFSTESEVYMPHSMRIYGKYLIHGEAYYPSGIPYISQVSGGCVRVRDHEVDDLYEIVEEGLPVLSITHLQENFPKDKGSLASFPKINAESFLVADIESGKVFAGKNINEPKSIASITKLMTAIVTTEQMGLARPIRVQDYMLELYGSTEGLTEGKRVRLVDLLNPLLVESSNDAAQVLAHYLGRISTLEKMNEKADSIGMENSQFVGFSGLKKENLSTARDLYYLGYYLANTRIPLLKITKEAWVSEIDYNVFSDLENKNIFYEEKSFLGGKTGYTKDSNHTGLFLFEMNLAGKKRRILFTVLGARSKKDMKEAVLGLKNWLNNSY